MSLTIQQLIAILAELSALLEYEGAPHWCEWMLDVKTKLEASDDSGVEKLLSAYGGMGSFNDLVLGQIHDGTTFAWKANANEINEQLDSLRSEAWKLANFIKMNPTVSGP